MPDRNTDRQSDLAVMDVGEYNNKRRLEAILDRHDAVPQTWAEARLSYITGEIGRQAYQHEVFWAVKQAIIEQHNLLQQSESLRFYGRVNGQQPDIDPIGIVDLGQAQNVIWNLQSFREADATYTVRTDVTTTDSYGHQVKETQTQTYYMPLRVSSNAYLRLKEFMEEQGIEIHFEEIGDELPIWGFEEVEQDEVADAD